MNIWKCAGCGIAGPDTSRLCDCATNYVISEKITASIASPQSIAAPKTGPSFQEMRDKAIAAGKYCVGIAPTERGKQ